VVVRESNKMQIEGNIDTFAVQNAENQIHMYEAYSESAYRFAVKKSIKFLIKFYCYQVLHSSNYFSTYSPSLLRHLS